MSEEIIVEKIEQAKQRIKSDRVQARFVDVASKMLIISDNMYIYPTCRWAVVSVFKTLALFIFRLRL